MKRIFTLFVLGLSTLVTCRDLPTEPPPVPIQLELGLLASYTFNGNANDASGLGNHGTLYGPTLTVDRFGNSGSAYHFARGAYIRIPELLPDSCEGFTFAAWVKKDSTDNGTHVIMYKGMKKGEALLTVTPTDVQFGVNLYVPGAPPNSENWYTVGTVDTLKAGTYYFVVGRYARGQKVDLCINGKQVSSLAVPSFNLFADTSRTYSAIGNHTTPSLSPYYWWNGIIDDIRIYNRALTDEEVLALFQQGS